MKEQREKEKEGGERKTIMTMHESRFKVQTHMSSQFSPRSRTHQTSKQQADSPARVRHHYFITTTSRDITPYTTKHYMTDQQLFPGAEHSLHCPGDQDLIILNPSLGIRESNPGRKQPSCPHLSLPSPFLLPPSFPPALPPYALPTFCSSLNPSIPLSSPPSSFLPSLHPSLPPYTLPFFDPSLLLSHCSCLLHDLSKIPPSTSNEGSMMLNSNIQTQVYSRVVVRVTCKTISHG